MAAISIKRTAGIATAATVGVAASAIGGWLSLSRVAIDRRLPLPPAIDAERRTFTGLGAGQLSYYVARVAAGRPLVLVHSINAAASAHEMRPLFESYRARRPVYALDFPGFGFSARGNRAYTPALFTAAIEDLLKTEVHEAGPVDLIAFSLGSEFAALAALELGGRIRSLTIISPTGLGHRRDGETPEEQRRSAQTSERTLRAFSLPLWSQPLYDLISTRASIRWFLQSSFVGEVDRELADYSYLVSHQPGARYAPLAFISGQLFTANIRTKVYERLDQPVLVLYDQDQYTSFEQLPGVLERHANWQAARIVPTKGLPHFEELAQTTAALDRFWVGIDDPA